MHKLAVVVQADVLVFILSSSEQCHKREKC